MPRVESREPSAALARDPDVALVFEQLTGREPTENEWENVPWLAALGRIEKRLATLLALDHEFAMRGQLGASPQDVAMYRRMVEEAEVTAQRDAARGSA